MVSHSFVQIRLRERKCEWRSNLEEDGLNRHEEDGSEGREGVEGR